MIKTKLKNRNLSQEDVFNFSELFKLMKPRVMSLVIFTCAVGLLMAPNVISTKDAIIGIILVSIGAGAAGALNMWYESDLDALMTRTCLRPIPTGKVNKNQALVFGVALSIFSVIALDFFANRISASLLLFTILFTWPTFTSITFDLALKSQVRLFTLVSNLTLTTLSKTMSGASLET